MKADAITSSYQSIPIFFSLKGDSRTVFNLVSYYVHCKLGDALRLRCLVKIRKLLCVEGRSLVIT